MKQPVLACQQLSKSYREGATEINVLQSIDFNIEQADMIAIVGRSGSGKSTLLHLLAGLDQPSSGQVYLQGRDYQTLSEVEKCRWRNQHLGFIYQFHHLLPEFTALENVSMPLLIRSLPLTLVQDKATHLLDLVGLNARLNHRPAELSGGERQRVAIARALISEPACLLADEPTGNLDAENAEKVLELFLTLPQHSQTSLVLVTHDIRLAQQAKRVYQLVDGKLREEA